MNNTPTDQEHLDVGSAPFFIYGTLWTLAGIIGQAMTYVPEVQDRALAISGFFLFTGISMIGIGIGVMKKWRHIWIPAMAFTLLGLLSFPVGTLLCGWAAYSLWKGRRGFYPFDKNTPRA